MQQNLKFKAAVIVAVILICIYGIIGLPKSKDELIANWNRNIRLGLDLRGGTHLVMQVQLQDAFKAAADGVMDRLKDEMKKAGIDYAAMDRNDPGRIEGWESANLDV
jgi:preprotein translocase subunit SecD